MSKTNEPVKYVVAVSGGVDSMVLLDILRTQPGVRLIVAHYDHGIRPDSIKDRQLVQVVAARHNLPFIYDMGNLGPGASEAAARTARYKFLHDVRKASGAKAIVTAHHQDDLLETAIINLLRGTGRRGLSSLKSGDRVLRPLLSQRKQQLIDYARAHRLEWREDSTNQSPNYLRNRVRHTIMPKFDEASRQKLLGIIERAAHLNQEIDGLLANQLHLQPARDRLDRQWFIMLPHIVALETMASWLRNNGITNYDARTLQRLVIATKSFHPGKRTDINGSYHLVVEADEVALQG